MSDLNMALAMVQLYQTREAYMHGQISEERRSKSSIPQRIEQITELMGFLQGNGVDDIRIQQGEKAHFLELSSHFSHPLFEKESTQFTAKEADTLTAFLKGEAQKLQMEDQELFEKMKWQQSDLTSCWEVAQKATKDQQEAVAAFLRRV